MDLERPFTRKKKASSPRLARACADLAMTLSAGKWPLQRQRKIGIERFVIEELGLGLAQDCGPEPIELFTRAAFSAHKYSETHKEGFNYDRIQYDVRLSVGQSLLKEEIPGSVMVELFTNDEEREGTVLEDLTGDDLDGVLIMREEEIGYRVSEDGEILGYDIAHNYLIDDELVYEMEYSSKESKPGYVPVYRDENEKVIDSRPSEVSFLTQAGIEREAAAIDESHKLFMAEHSLRRSLELRGRSGRDHRRHALGIVSLVGSGFTIVSSR